MMVLLQAHTVSLHEAALCKQENIPNPTSIPDALQAKQCCYIAPLKVKQRCLITRRRVHRIFMSTNTQSTHTLRRRLQILHYMVCRELYNRDSYNMFINSENALLLCTLYDQARKHFNNTVCCTLDSCIIPPPPPPGWTKRPPRWTKRYHRYHVNSIGCKPEGSNFAPDTQFSLFTANAEERY